LIREDAYQYDQYLVIIVCDCVSICLDYCSIIITR
jgi:hypothetical protein